MLSVIYRVSSLGLFGYCAHATISNILSAGKGLRIFFFKTENEKMVQYYQNEIRTKYFAYKYTRLGGIVEWWLAPPCHSNKAFLFRSSHVLSVPVWVLSEYSGFFPQSKDMHGVTSNGDSKLARGMNVSPNACLSLCINPVIDRPLQIAAHLLPCDSWDGLQHPYMILIWISRNKWMCR